MVKGLRVVGHDTIEPDETTKLKLARAGVHQVIATVKLCLTAAGSVKSLRMLKSSGYPPYDRKIQSKMRTWKHRPYLDDGKPIPVCTPVTFIYRQPKPDSSD